MVDGIEIVLVRCRPRKVRLDGDCAVDAEYQVQTIKQRDEAGRQPGVGVWSARRALQLSVCAIALSGWSMGNAPPAFGADGSIAGFGAQRGSFTVTFDAMALAPDTLAYVGLSQSPLSDPSRFAAAIRFNPSGVMDVLGGTGQFSYVPNLPYHVRMAVNVPAHLYTVFVAPAGQAEHVLAENVAFAPAQKDVKSLGFVAKSAATGDVKIDQTKVPPSCPYEAKAKAAKLDDGCPRSPEAGFSNPAILTKYGANRPQWDVAGVDYDVGINPAQKLVDWQTLGSTPGIDIYLGAVRCDGATAAHPTSNPVVLDNIDFTTHGGTYIYVPVQGCAGLTIKHSKFGNAGGTKGCVGGGNNPWYWYIQDQNPGMPLTVVRNSFDSTNCSTGNAAVIYAFGPTIVRYNYFGHLQGQAVQAPPGNDPVDYRFNYIEDCCYTNNHMNFQEFGSAVDASMDLVAFNTTYLYKNNANAPGEEYQFYGNTGGTQQAAMLENNTIIALDTGSCQSSQVGCLASFAIHGTSNTTPSTSTVAQPQNTGNYFDVSGMFGAYYPGSMSGWNSSGNVNMVTGQIIVPQ
jgi:hypothetical protein